MRSKLPLFSLFLSHLALAGCLDTKIKVEDSDKVVEVSFQ